MSRLARVGYIDVDHQELEVNRVLNDPEHSIPIEIMGAPVGPTVAAMGDAVFNTVVSEMLEATEHHRRDDQLVIPQHTHVLSALAG